MAEVRKEIIDELTRDGFTFPVQLFPKMTVQGIRSAWDRLEQGEGFKSRGINRPHSRQFDQRFVWDIAANPRLLDIVEAVLGPNILLFGTRFFCKYGGDGAYVTWHQDACPETWGLQPPIALTAWYAIDEITEANGCMYMLPGSHTSGIRTHAIRNRPGNILSRGRELTPSRQELASAVPILLQPGEISLHYGTTVHSSGRNTKSGRRCGLAIRYVPTTVRQVENSDWPASRAVLLRGVDREGHFRKEDPPFPFPAASPSQSTAAT
jgi:ectoine hydroxylase-related dioxygenase (phytanoyl-CoA dioxygenase family)